MLAKVARVAGPVLASIGIQKHLGKKGHENQKELQEKQFQNQQELNNQGQQMQMEMWKNTNYPEQVQQLMEAGLNPGLLYGKTGGQGATTGSQTGGSATGQNYSHAPIMDVGKQAMTSAQMEMMQAQTEKVKAETVKLKGPDTEQVWATIDNIKADTANKGVINELNAQQAYNVQLQNITEVERANAIISKANAEAAQIVQNTEITAETREDIIRARALENMLTEAKILEMETKIKVEEQSIKKMIDDVIIGYQNADANKTRNENEILKQALMKELKQMDIDQRWWEMWVKAAGKGIGDLLNLIPTKIIKTFIRGGK